MWEGGGLPAKKCTNLIKIYSRFRHTLKHFLSSFFGDIMEIKKIIGFLQLRTGFE